MDFSNILQGFANLASVEGALYIIVGVFVGMMFGCVPGLNGSTAIALFIPITYVLEPAISIGLLMSLMIGGVSGGLISAILLNIPGTAASFGTTFDGHPMAMRGEAGKALGTGIVFSVLGTLVSTIIMLFLAPALADFALSFGSREYFAVALFALTMVASMSGGNMVRGLISGCLGFIIAMVGIAPVDYTHRFTFGSSNLVAGFALISVLTGPFAVAEVMKNAKKSRSNEKLEVYSYKFKGFGFTTKEFVKQIPNAIRSAIIGMGVGILPGVGASTSNLISYQVAKDTSKHPEKFGTGIMDGLVATETANNATCGGAMIPMLALGIPGDIATALLLGALTLQGIQPGPLLFTSNPDLVFTIFASLILANFVMIILARCGMKVFVKLLSVSKAILMPAILVLCCVGAFSNGNNSFDIVMLGVFGIIGMVMQKFDFPIGPMIIGYIVGPMCELNLRRALVIGDGQFSYLFGSPIAIVFYALTILSIAMAVRRGIKANKAAKAKGEVTTMEKEDF